MNYDVIIIGAGPAGLALACSLKNTGLNILIIEKSTLDTIQDPVIDGRDIALTHLSRKLLTKQGVWSRIPATSVHPIRKAQVLDGDSPYCLDFDNQQATTDALGYLVANHVIRKALHEQVTTLSSVKILTGMSADAVHTDDHIATVRLSNGETISARLLVAADSRFSETRRRMGISADMHDFGRVAIVCRMEHELANDGTAFECFHYGRTLAVLPLSDNLSSIVITAPTDVAEEILGMDEELLNADIRQRFHNRLGGMKLTGKLYPYPLVAVHARKFVAKRFAVIGDAAVGMHPVTAHGFNLGLRGQDTLATGIKAALRQGTDIAAPGVLEKYQATHRQVTRPLYAGTNHIVSLFTDDRPPAKILRKLALRFGNHFPPVKRMISNQLTEMDASRNTFLRFPL